MSATFFAECWPRKPLNDRTDSLLPHHLPMANDILYHQDSHVTHVDAIDEIYEETQINLRFSTITFSRND